MNIKSLRKPALWAVVSAGLAASVVACGSDSNNDSTDGGTGGSDNGTGGTSTGGTSNKGGGGTTTGGSGGAKGGAGGATGGSGGAAGAGATGGKGGTAGVGGKGGAGGTEPDGGPDGRADAGTDSGDAGCVPAESFTSPTVPVAIEVPAGHRLLHHFRASGTQDYTCTASAGADPTYTWSSAVPDAFLYDSCNHQVIQHSAGPKWTWLSDESAIIGTRVASSDVTGAIPQLLLSAAAASGASTGVLTPVKYVQRLDTTGGVQPAAGDCTAATVNQVKKIPYTANYYFYVSTPTDAGADADSGN
jgi:hypothetical protein